MRLDLKALMPVQVLLVLVTRKIMTMAMTMTKNAKEKIVLKEMMVPVKEKTALKMTMTKNAKEKIVLKKMMVPVKEKTALKTPVKKNPPMMMMLS